MNPHHHANYLNKFRKAIFLCFLFIACNFNLQAQIAITTNVYGNCANITSTSNGTIVIISVGGGATPYTYLWNNGSTNYIINNLATGTYTVTVTGGNSVTVTETIVIQNYTPPVTPIITGVHYGCLGYQSYNVTNPQTGVSYNWSATSNSITIYGAGTAATIDFLANGFNGSGVITFTATDQITGCSSSATFTVYQCCSGAFDFSNMTISDIITNQPSGFTYTQNGNSWTISQNNPSLTIAINGTFTIDHEVVLKDWNCKMGPDASIIVNDVSNATFEAIFLKCTLNTCNHDYMWQGIIGDPGAGILFRGGSVLEEAQQGIIIDNGDFHFDQSVINSCYTGAIIRNTIGNANCGIYRMNFGCNNLNTGLPQNLIAPFAGMKTKNGLQIFNSSNILLGYIGMNNNIFQNTFHHINNAVYINNSNVDVYHNIFEDIQRYDYAGTGIAIEAAKGIPSMNVNIGDMDVWNLKKSNSFTRCRIGIHAHHNTNLTVGYNTFTDIRNTLGTFDAGITETAIQVNNLNQNSIRINDNTFSNFETGVKVGTYNNCQVQIINNTFNSTVLAPLNEAAHGVLVNNPFTNSPQPLPLSIADNYFHHCRNGVHLNVCDFADVDNNIITFYDADITGPNANLVRYGIRASGGFGLHTINHNWIRKPGNTPTSNLKSKLFGINVQSTENNFVQNNLVEKTGTGIRFFNTSIINSLLCNNMDGNLFGLRLENAIIGNQGTAGFAQDNSWTNINLDIEGMGFTFITTFYSHSTSPPWTPDPNDIDPPSTYLFQNGAINTNCDVFHPQPLRDQILSIVNQDGDFNLLTPEEKYAANQSAFEKLHADSSMMNKGDADDAVLQNYHDSIATTNIGQLANGVTLNNSNLSSISPVNNAEENMKTLLGIYAVTWGIDIFDFTTEQFDALYNIASQNPITGGNAVYAARGMLHTFFDDDMMANGKLIHPVRLINLTQYNKGKLYPNPANDFAYYSIRLKKDEICTVQLIDLSGTILNTTSMKNENCLVPIQTTNLSQGIYCVRILINGMLFENHKLVKQ
nr:T9SS type A sorting domain-containing protein [Bacteroidota bacterium]